MLLEKLCNADGVSGNEDNIRRIILGEVKEYADSIEIDCLGNVIALKKGERHDKKIMISAHMDEVGFIISKITDKGYLKFKTVGGIDTRVILGKKVRINGDVSGIIGVKAIHLLSDSELESVPRVSELYIDIGADSEEEAKRWVSVGDYAAFDTKFGEMGENKIKAKAIDDRAGCVAAVNALRLNPEFDMYVCFTVQEEVGLRGSAVCAERVKPDAALVLESTTCSDVYKSKPNEYVTVCGGGAALSFMDGRTITDKRLYDSLKQMADKYDIKVQEKRTTMGGNDAGSIHLASGGIPTASLSVPCRYLHSPVGVADIEDINSMDSFVKAYIKEIGGIMKWN